MKTPSLSRSKLRTKQDGLFIVLFASLVGVFLFLTVGGLLIGEFSLTYDETDHFLYGLKVLLLQPERGDASSEMPISAVNALPFVLVNGFINPSYTDIRIGKISTIFISLLLGIICFTWLHKLYGKWVGLIGLALYILEPSIIAHSEMMTTDIFAAFTITLTLFFCWRFFLKPSFVRLLFLGLALGLCQITKFSGLFLYPILLLLGFFRALPALENAIRQRKIRKILLTLLKILFYGLLLITLSIVVINFGFFFKGSGLTLDRYTFSSEMLRSFQQIPLFQKIPILLPSPFIQALDKVLFIERTSADYGAIYLLGHRRIQGGFPGYYLVAFLLKVPLPIIALLAFSIWEWVRKFRWQEFIHLDMFLIIPTLAYSIYFNFFFQAQTGIRYLLVIFPLLLIFAARSLRNWFAFSRRLRIGFLIAGCWLVLSVASYFPNYLSYFNEIVINRTDAYRYLADSNLDWGQNDGVTKRYLSQHKDIHYNPQQPVAGNVMVDVNQFVGVLGEPETYQWLRDCCQPVGTFRHTALIFHVPPEALPPGK